MNTYKSHRDTGALFELTEEQKNQCVLSGDITIKIKHVNALGNALGGTTDLCQVQFNTAFIQNGNYIRAGKMEVSPKKILKNKEIPAAFMIIIRFEDVCNTCDPLRTTVYELCENCLQMISEQEVTDWHQTAALRLSSQPLTEEELKEDRNGLDVDYLAQAKEVKLGFNPDYYRLLSYEELQEARRRATDAEEIKERVNVLKVTQSAQFARAFSIEPEEEA